MIARLLARSFVPCTSLKVAAMVDAPSREGADRPAREPDAANESVTGSRASMGVAVGAESGEGALSASVQGNLAGGSCGRKSERQTHFPPPPAPLASREPVQVEHGHVVLVAGLHKVEIVYLTGALQRCIIASTPYTCAWV